MKKDMKELLNKPSQIMLYRNILNSLPTTSQELFYHSIANITLLRHKVEPCDVKQVIKQYKGAYSWLILQHKYMSYCMQNKIKENYNEFSVLGTLQCWVSVIDKLKTKKQFRFANTVAIDLRYRGIYHFQDLILYLNYITFDLIGLLKFNKAQINKSGQLNMTQNSIENSNKLQSHLQLDDLLSFINNITPKVLFNIVIPLSYFPKNILNISGTHYDLLYRNQNIEIVARERQHYQTLLKKCLKVLCSVQLTQKQEKVLLQTSIKYYYLFHHDRNLHAMEILVESIKKLSAAVRYAIMDQLFVFFTILNKLGDQVAIDYLTDQFSWVQSQILSKITEKSMVGVRKQLLKPFPGQQFAFTQIVLLDRSSKTRRYFEVYHKYTLIYYRIKVLQDDLTIRLYYDGDFIAQKEQKQILFERQREPNEVTGSLQAIETGIYYFEFDNSFSWMKGKNVSYELTLLVPMQIINQDKKPWLQVLFDKTQSNKVPKDKVLHFINSNQKDIWIASSNNVKITKSSDNLFNLSINRQNGSIYQYQTQSQRLLITKIKSINQQGIQWWINQQRFQDKQEALRYFQNFIKPNQEKFQEIQSKEKDQLKQHSAEQQNQNNHFKENVEQKVKQQTIQEIKKQDKRQQEKNEQRSQHRLKNTSQQNQQYKQQDKPSDQKQDQKQDKHQHKQSDIKQQVKQQDKKQDNQQQDKKQDKQQDNQQQDKQQNKQQDKKQERQQDQKQQMKQDNSQVREQDINERSNLINQKENKDQIVQNE